MSNSNSITELLAVHTRRLQELKKKKAALGLSADPSLALEIEDIEAQIQKLRMQLADDCADRLPAPDDFAVDGKLVLVVEDHISWQEILREYLVEIGCRVDLAVDFAQARDRLKDNSYNLVTIDAHLGPNAQAHEGMLLMDYIRNRFGAELPIIVVSGEINKQDLVRAYQKFGVSTVFLKENFECNEFQSAVWEALQPV